MGRIPLVKPGERIRATDHNRMVLQMNAVLGLSGSRGTNIKRAPGGMSIASTKTLERRARGIVAWGENSTATDIAQFDTVCISGQIAEDIEGERQVLLGLGDFSSDADLPKLAIALDDIAAGAMGRVMVSGVAMANVHQRWTIHTSSGNYASPSIGSRSMVIGATGHALVLYDRGDGLALVRFPVGGVSGGGGGEVPARAWIDFGWAQ